MTSNTATINREARDKVKGFRFQRLRAVELMLRAMIDTEDAYIYCAIENIGDIHLHSDLDPQPAEYIEEDKDYAIGTSFSLNSPQVLKTLIGFIDAWHTYELSKTFYFGFCTTASIAKENKTSKINALEIDLPETPILDLLSCDERLESEDLNIIKSLVIEAYDNEYSRHKTNGHIDSIRKWSDDTWREFFDRITWYFGVSDENQLEQDLSWLLKQCPFYNDRLRGKEDHVISLLVDKFDQKQNKQEFASRFVHSSDVLLTAKNVESGEYKLSDPAWKMWKDLPPPTDTRNLIDKVRAVSPKFKSEKLDIWCRKASLSRYEQDEFKHDKSILSLRYRVLLSCCEKLDNIMPQSEDFDSVELEKCVDDLISCAEEHIRQLSVDYKYILSSKIAIHGMILELIDSCFLSFDKNGDID